MDTLGVAFVEDGLQNSIFKKNKMSWAVQGASAGKHQWATPQLIWYLHNLSNYIHNCFPTNKTCKRKPTRYTKLGYWPIICSNDWRSDLLISSNKIQWEQGIVLNRVKIKTPPEISKAPHWSSVCNNGSESERKMIPTTTLKQHLNLSITWIDVLWVFWVGG